MTADPQQATAPPPDAAADPGHDAGAAAGLGDAGPGTGLARYRRRRRVRTAVVLAAVTLVIGAAVAAGLGVGGRAGQRPAGGDLPPATARVTRATLTQTESISGSLSYGAETTVVARASLAASTTAGGADAGATGPGGSGGAGGGSGKPGAVASAAAATPGTLTWLPAVGAIVAPGQAVYRVENRPVVLLAGTLPLWRVLAPGVRGDDVKLLEGNLRAFGYTGFRVDSTYSAATAGAVRRWQRHLGWEQTGTVDVNQVVVAPGRLRVTGRKAAVGGEASGEVLAYTSTTRVVTVALDVSKQQLVRVGLRATLALPDGRTLVGRVASIGTVASAGTAGDAQGGQGGDQPGTATIPVVVTIADQRALGRLDAAPVQLTLVTSQRRNVLAVPVGALVALAEGGYGVQVVEGASTRYVAVRTGMFADGRVEVSGVGIRPGVVVGVPA